LNYLKIYGEGTCKVNDAYYIHKDKGTFWKVDKNFICYYYSLGKWMEAKNFIRYYYSLGKWMEAMNNSPNFYSDIFMDAVAENQLIRITKQEFENSLMLKELKK